jgi:hypothetical protein
VVVKYIYTHFLIFAAYTQEAIREDSLEDFDFYLIPAALIGFWGCRLDYVTGNVALQSGKATPRDIDMLALA